MRFFFAFTVLFLSYNTPIVCQDNDSPTEQIAPIKKVRTLSTMARNGTTVRRFATVALVPLAIRRPQLAFRIYCTNRAIDRMLTGK